ncbi:FHF complex subunit HOOK-interacting protein 2B-like isoform X2 [Cololabis saira]|uniref:FHF complex subunit HOOK-interacting protein 2B-like isoform X2 n=1 Tax=Cololabis saira TaxID=129043 RepID=UPI002AD2D23D|nr:FHF complex subunit HOOK-interacting protein 2B-like isoform X2 [Cololabis saira]
MDAFNKLTGLLLRALETREPTVDLLSSFIDHWKSITNYYMETTDDNCPAGQTDIPWNLRQMVDILVYEEKQQDVEDTGPCLEYLLQHKLLETLCTLGKAQVLLFFFKFLSQMQKPLLQLINVYRPVQKLIGLCGLPGSDTEKEETQFLLVLCSRIKQEPHALGHVLEPINQPAASSQSQSIARSNHSTDPETLSTQSRCSQASPVQPESSRSSPVQPESSRSSPVQPESSRSGPARPESSQSGPARPESGLLWALLQLSGSRRGPVRSRACEGLLLLAGLAGPEGALLSAQTQLGPLLAGRLQELYSLLPQEDAAALQNWSSRPWSAGLRSESPDHMSDFFCWLDFLDQLTRDAPQVLAVHVSQCVGQLFLVETLHPQLLNTCEQVVLVSTSVLCAAVRLIQSWYLLDQLVHFLLRTKSLTELMLQHCDHISDQISMVSLSLVDELLQKPHRDILDVLVLRYLSSRSYLSWPATGQEDAPLHPSEDSADSEDLEEDPFFSHPPPECPAAAALGSAEDVVSSFLCLVPVQVRSAQLQQEGGCEFYVHDAHTLVTQCQALSLSWDWPEILPVPGSSSAEQVFVEGQLLKVLLDRLGRILEQPYELNLQLTAILSRLSAFGHPLLHEYLLNPYTPLRDGARSMFSVLVRVVGELMQRIQQVPQLSERLLEARRHLLGLNTSSRLEHLTLVRGIIVLEEFCKELAAIAFVTLPLDHDSAEPGLTQPGESSDSALTDQDQDQDQDQLFT